MSPQRDDVVRYLMAQVARYRADLAVQRSKAGQTGEGLAHNMIVTPLQGMIDDAAQLLDRLRRRQGSSDEGDEERIGGSAIGEAAEQA